MSSAFVKEGEYQPLNTVEPELSALLFYLRRENAAIPIRVIKNYYCAKYQKDIHEMSDGFTYALDNNNKWTVILD